MITQTDRDRLKALLKELSVQRGDFVLASGLHSRVYIDAKLTTCQAAAMPLIGRAFLSKIEEHRWHPAAVGGLVIGSDPIVMAIAHESVRFRFQVDAFLVRKEPKKHGLKKFIEGISATGGLDVVIIDDVCSTGGSTALAIERSRESGLNVLGAVCLVDREMGAKHSIENSLGCPFDSVFTLSELLNDHESCDPVAIDIVGARRF
jgi:orotate phosphoribosyltransferase